MLKAKRHSYFYNLDNHRSDRVVKIEIKALLESKPAFLDLVETIGNTLPQVNGYELIRDRNTESRENIASYIREDIPVRGVHWIELSGTWARPNRAGEHEPRSILVYRAGRMQRIVAHQPPRNVDNWQSLQNEGINALYQIMRARNTRESRRRPRLLTWDSNAVVGDQGPNPQWLANLINGEVHGGYRIDNAVTRGRIEVTDIDFFTDINGIKLQSDHNRAVKFKWAVNSKWLRR